MLFPYSFAMNLLDPALLKIGLLVLAVAHVLALIAAGHALLRKRDSRAALGWVAVCVLTPLIGPLLYVLFGIARTDSRALRLMKRAARTKPGANLHGGLFHARPHGFVEHETLPEPARLLAMPGKHLTGRHVVGGNHISAFCDGEAAYPRMLEAINTATSHVYLSSFIFDNDSVGRRFAEALCAASKRGCDVRLLVDGVGALHMALPSLFGDSLRQQLTRQGVRVGRFLPPLAYPLQFSINLRNHRKVLVCDGVYGFTGGMNISAHHLAHTGKVDRVRDIHFAFTGPAVTQLQAGFLMDWDFVSGEPGHSPLPVYAPTAPNAPYCRMLMDGPGSTHDTIHDLFCAMISEARRSVRIMSPYFLPTHELTGALSSAVLRGVRVEVILPAYNNQKLVDWAMTHQLPDLVRRGVDIRYQPPPFAHTKLMLVDGVYTLLGSANLDPRSLRLNFELVMEVFDPALTGSLTKFFHNTRNISTPLAPNARRPLPVRLRNAAAWIFSPYL